MFVQEEPIQEPSIKPAVTSPDDREQQVKIEFAALKNKVKGEKEGSSESKADKKNPPPLGLPDSEDIEKAVRAQAELAVFEKRLAKQDAEAIREAKGKLATEARRTEGESFDEPIGVAQEYYTVLLAEALKSLENRTAKEEFFNRGHYHKQESIPPVKQGEIDYQGGQRKYVSQGEREESPEKDAQASYRGSSPAYSKYKMDFHEDKGVVAVDAFNMNVSGKDDFKITCENGKIVDIDIFLPVSPVYSKKQGWFPQVGGDKKYPSGFEWLRFRDLGGKEVGEPFILLSVGSDTIKYPASAKEFTELLRAVLSWIPDKRHLSQGNT